jgi:hypothetical protein
MIRQRDAQRLDEVEVEGDADPAAKLRPRMRPPLSRVRTTSIQIPGINDHAPPDDGVVPKDQTSEAIGFFGSERTPATLFAGSAITILFAFPLKHGEPEDICFYKRAYVVLVTMSFCNSLVSVIAASLAITRLLGHNHDAKARDALSMMLREYPLFFLACRAHFLTGVLMVRAPAAARRLTERAVPLGLARSATAEPADPAGRPARLPRAPSSVALALAC